MSNEYRGLISVTMVGAPVRISYRVMWGSQPHILEAYMRGNLDMMTAVGGFPDAVRVRIYDAIIADVREQEAARLAERAGA
jgi:hypothetical protein